MYALAVPDGKLVDALVNFKGLKAANRAAEFQKLSQSILIEQGPMHRLPEKTLLKYPKVRKIFQPKLSELTFWQKHLRTEKVRSKSFWLNQVQQWSYLM